MEYDSIIESILYGCGYFITGLLGYIGFDHRSFFSLILRCIFTFIAILIAVLIAACIVV